MLFDSHAHLNYEKFTDEDRKALIDTIEAFGKLGWVMDIGFDMPSSRQAVEDAKNISWCYAAVGVHPHDTNKMTEEDLQELERLSKEEKVKAIGEIGLDFHYDFSERDKQRYWFRRQIQLANKLKMPIVIHSREADRETMDILIEEGAFSSERKSFFPKRNIGGSTFDDARVLLHCYSGSAELAKEYINLGATISICGPVTFKNNKKTQKVVKEIPLDYLLVETDSPYLTPEPHRGKKNNSTFVEYTARKVAELKEISYEEVEEITAKNAKVFFNILGD